MGESTSKGFGSVLEWKLRIEGNGCIIGGGPNVGWTVTHSLTIGKRGGAAPIAVAAGSGVILERKRGQWYVGETGIKSGQTIGAGKRHARRRWAPARCERAALRLVTVV